jgi:DNA topoisomerase-1
VQLGEAADGEKPKRASIPKGYAIADVDLELALKLLALPREVGLHPETGKPIVAGIGRYGPFVEHDGKYANLEGAQDVFEIGLNRAVTVLAEKKAGRGRAAPKAAVLKSLGEHPTEGGKVEILDGRFGPYVRHGKTNATIPKGTPPESLTLEQAVELIAARAARGPSKGFRRGAKAAKPKAALATEDAE